jgi:hypothetical protein
MRRVAPGRVLAAFDVLFARGLSRLYTIDVRGRGQMIE